ncbi:Response regulator PleD [Novipirellula aureliae]|uniref:diguanylate cyclase n=1 Tax=Novipirellula aureliae TaxID=2527966 RepID=A0A5C6DXH4_9BACT|nr:GGDEF domain-containing protein [Novipirellula aureliae]TWU41358.1 Response regulator PleD [Novipirellula aureliae]
MSICIKEKRKRQGEDVTKAFGYAKEALGYVAKFRTPPTPNVYEVWYRYAEGQLQALRDQLSYAVNDAQTADYELLLKLYNQYFSTNDTGELSYQLGEQLSFAIGNVESIISDQLTAQDEFKTAIGSASDAIDHQDKDVSPDILQACLASILDSNKQMQRQLSKMASRLDESRNQVGQLRENFIESQKKLMTDPLTGVGNRLFFDNCLNNAIESPDRAKRHVFLLLIDLDNFKLVNDSFGHSTGDQVLKYVSLHLQRLVVGGSVARYGGDEFAVFITTDNLNDGVQHGDAICQFFAKNRLSVNQTGEMLGKLTTSIGGALLRSEDSSSSWFERADRLLYSSKNAGRNRVMVERKIK